MFKLGSRWLVVMGLFVLAALGLSARTAAAQGMQNEVEIVGVIQSVNAGAIMVNDFVVDVTAAEVKLNLEVGLEVRVEGFLIGSMVRAREVQTAEDGIRPEELEIIGTLESLDATTAVVNGFSFDVSSAEVDAGLAVGDLVKVHASLSDADVWVAREMEAFTPEDSPVDDGNDDSGDEGEFETVGTLEEIGEDYIVVSGQRFDISEAEIKDTLALGTLVKIHASQVDGALVAREVEQADQDDLNDDGFDDDDGDDDSDDDSGDDNGSDDSQDDSSHDMNDDNGGSGSDDSSDDNGQGSDDSGSDDSVDDSQDDNGGQGSDDSGSDDSQDDSSDDSGDDSQDDNGGDHGGDDSQDDNGGDDD